jgi:AraC family transcriptional regulator
MHRHDTSSVTIILGGEIYETTRNDAVTGSALSVVVKPPGVLHADTVGPQGARTLQVAFPLESMPHLDDSLALERWRWLHGSAVTVPFTALALAIRQPTVQTDELEDRVIEVLTSIGNDRDTKDSAPPAWLVRVKNAVDEQLDGRPRLSTLAALVGVHPVSVSRAFHRYYGRTVSEYRRSERVRRAAGWIANSTETLSRIAQTAGYADHPHLCREFQRVTGVSPSRYRRLAG